MQLKTITSQLGYLILTATFFIFYPSDNVYALGNQDQGSLVKADPPVGRLKKIRRSREGPILGFGIGVGRISFTEPLAEYWNTIEEARSKATGQSPLPREPRSALATELKIGHGLSDQFLFYYTSRILWAPLQRLYRDTMIANGAAGMGIMCFPFPRRDIYLVGSIGLAALVTWDPPFSLENARQTGVAVSGGIGYELASHLSIDFTVGFGNANRTRVDDLMEVAVTNEVVTFLVTLNGLVY